jgi:hypothetical protein
VSEEDLRGKSKLPDSTASSSDPAQGKDEDEAAERDEPRERMLQ